MYVFVDPPVCTRCTNYSDGGHSAEFHSHNGSEKYTSSVRIAFYLHMAVPQLQKLGT